MNDPRRTEPLTDAALDREIRDALAIDPSPEFLPRVRARVADEPSPTAWHGAWPARVRWALAASAVVAMLAAATVLRNRSEMPVSPGNPAGEVVSTGDRFPSGDVAAAPAPPLVRREPARPVRRISPPPPPAPQPARHAGGLPEVILAENERRAFRALAERERLEIPEITVSAERAAGARPALPPLSFEPLAMGRPLFAHVSLE
jgi:hypothetical protein